MLATSVTLTLLVDAIVPHIFRRVISTSAAGPMEVWDSLANYTSKYNFSIIAVRARGIHFLLDVHYSSL